MFHLLVAVTAISSGNIFQFLHELVSCPSSMKSILKFVGLPFAILSQGLKKKICTASTCIWCTSLNLQMHLEASPGEVQTGR